MKYIFGFSFDGKLIKSYNWAREILHCSNHEHIFRLLKEHCIWVNNYKAATYRHAEVVYYNISS